MYTQNTHTATHTHTQSQATVLITEEVHTVQQSWQFILIVTERKRLCNLIGRWSMLLLNGQPIDSPNNDSYIYPSREIVSEGCMPNSSDLLLLNDVPTCKKKRKKKQRFFIADRIEGYLFRRCISQRTILILFLFLEKIHFRAEWGQRVRSPRLNFSAIINVNIF